MMKGHRSADAGFAKLLSMVTLQKWLWQAKASVRARAKWGAIMGSMPREIAIPLDEIQLLGSLQLTDGARGIVVFAHGSGSSRFSPRNRFVAGTLNDAGLATLLFDLLTEEEEAVDMITAELRFDIGLLADRLIEVIDWLATYEETRHLKIGCFGASTGAAAALIAAAARPQSVYAVVSRGGRPDLAERALSQVTAPTLLIVGGYDERVIQLNEQALKNMPPSIDNELTIVPRASHLFEEPGTLEEVARLARDWFVKYLGASATHGAA